MNRIIDQLASRPFLGRLFLAAIAIVVAACGSSGGRPGY
jgi:hypothetical protein